MTELLIALSARNRSLQRIGEFTVLSVTLVLVMYFVATGVEQAEMLRAV